MMQINPAEFKLLVVDDVQTNVLLLKALLSKDGYGILVANNGQEALEVIRNEIICIFVTFKIAIQHGRIE